MNLTADQAVVIALASVCVVLVDIIKKAAGINNDNYVRLLALLLGIGLAAFYYATQIPPPRWQEVAWNALFTGVGTVIAGAAKSAVPDKRTDSDAPTSPPPG